MSVNHGCKRIKLPVELLDKMKPIELGEDDNSTFLLGGNAECLQSTMEIRMDFKQHLGGSGREKNHSHLGRERSIRAERDGERLYLSSEGLQHWSERFGIECLKDRQTHMWAGADLV